MFIVVILKQTDLNFIIHINMDAIGFTLEESGYVVDNTAILEYYFEIKETSYRFILRAEDSVWRFGVKFYNHHKKAFENEKLIYISVGEKGDEYSSETGVEVRHTGFQKDIVVWYALESIDSKEPVELVIHPVLDKGGLYVSFTAPDKSFNYTFVKMPPSAMYFQAVAWSVGNTFCVHGTLEKYKLSEIAQSLDPFQVDHIRFRMGNMFDHHILAETNLTLLPVSTNGTAKPTIRSEAKALGLPSLISPGTPGQVSIYPTSLGPGKFAGYAYSVNSHSRDLDLLKQLFENIKAESKKQKNITYVNMPMLGTGAGQIPIQQVIETMDEEFNKKKLSIDFVVSIPSAEHFLEVRLHFAARLFPLPPEEQKEKPLILEELEHQININLKPSDYRLDIDGNVIYLNLSQQQVFSTRAISKLEYLRELNISHAGNPDLRFLSELQNLESLIAISNKIDGVAIENLPKLKSLDLSHCNIKNIDFLASLLTLERLTIKGNRINDINPVVKLTELNYLDVSSNNISDLKPLKTLRKLTNLNLSSNKLDSVDEVLGLTSLMILDVSNNQLHDIPDITVLRNLNFVKADFNPFEKFSAIILNEKGNHLITLQNFLLRQQEKSKLKITLPAKVLLLGNHGSGKTSLLYYLQNKQLSGPVKTTHLIQIEKFPRDCVGIPQAIFFDFGGQDYYHGLYRAFLTGGAVYVLLWREENNQNNLAVDANNLFIRNFSLNYWLGQKQYLEKQKFFTDETSPIILVQTHAKNDKKSYPEDMAIHQICGDVFVELSNGKLVGTAKSKNASGLSYLRSMILETIEQKSTVRKEPEWFIEFINQIVLKSKTSDFKSLPISDLLPYYKTGATLQELEAELDQLHKQGLILYYNDAIPNCVWLNPVELVKYIHDHILNKDILKASKPGIIPYAELDEIAKDKNIVELLVQQKVLFRHQQDNSYIIPNFLPLSESDDQLGLLTFGLQKPFFLLKFEKFLPFGLINQIICYFGMLPDKKMFWRDQLIFTIDKTTKILININFSNLIINVYVAFDNAVDSTNKQIIERYLFYGIMGLYWDLPMLNFTDFKMFHRQELILSEMDPNDSLYLAVLNANDLYENMKWRPSDMFISTNGKEFINYAILCESSDNTMIHSLSIGHDGLLKDQGNVIPIYQFQPFTNLELKRPLKAVISYSKRDVKLVNKFRQYLVPLADDGLMENPWYCSELIAGDPWDEVIQGKFDKADIIFFMVSENLMSTQYVKDNEIKNAIDKWNRYQSIKIVPIILNPYHWARSGDYNLADFTALPYTGLAVTVFPNQNQAWNFISEGIRIMIEQKIFPGSMAFQANFEMEQFFEKVMRYRDQQGL